MSTFGEINEPSSRTVWEDWDDSHSSENDAKLCLAKIVEIPKEIDAFIILEGTYLYDCLRTQRDLELVNTCAEVNLRIYKNKKCNNYVCVLKDYSLILTSEIVELIKDYMFISTNVIAILTKPLVEYQLSEIITKDYVTKSLSTSKQSSNFLDISFPKLEQPNIISGVTAGVLCWREIFDMPAVAVVCYIEHPEQQPIQDLYVLLENFKVISHDEKPHRDNLYRSNLYI